MLNQASCLSRSSGSRSLLGIGNAVGLASAVDAATLTVKVNGVCACINGK